MGGVGLSYDSFEGEIPDEISNLKNVWFRIYPPSDKCEEKYKEENKRKCEEIKKKLSKKGKSEHITFFISQSKEYWIENKLH